MQADSANGGAQARLDATCSSCNAACEALAPLRQTTAQAPQAHGLALASGPARLVFGVSGAAISGQSCRQSLVPRRCIPVRGTAARRRSSARRPSASVPLRESGRHAPRLSISAPYKAEKSRVSGAVGMALLDGGDVDLLGIDRWIVRNVVLVSDQQPQAMGTRREGDFGFGLAAAEVHDVAAHRLIKWR